MPSRTSFFNKTLFWKNITRFWPLWAVYTAIWAIVLPIPMFINHMEEVRYGFTGLTQNTVERMLDSASGFGTLMAFFFGLLCAVAVFSYLNNSRSAGLMHTLPIRREGLFLTNWLSGYCFMLIPHLFIAILTLAVEAAAGVLDLPALFLWLLIQGGTCFFFYSLAVFLAMFTGHILALPALYVIFNFLAMGLSALLGQLISIFTFGYVNQFDNADLVEWLTPVITLPHHLYYRTVTENGVELRLFTGFQYVLAYAAVAALLLVAALVLYRLRHVETAGDVIAVSWAKPIFKYGVAFCAAICGGMLLFYMFSSLFTGVLIPLTICMILAGAVGLFVAEMLLQKTFKVFRRGWLSCGVFSLVLVVLMFGLSRDLFGLETWTPDPSQVESVDFNTHDMAPYDSANYSENLTDPQLIAKVISIHQSIVDNRAVYRQSERNWDEKGTYNYYRFQYILKDGRRVVRSYSFYLPSSDTPAPVITQTLSLMNDPAYLLSQYFPFDKYEAKAVSGTLSLFTSGQSSRPVPMTVELTATQAQAVAVAVRTDVAAGRLGIRYPDDNSPERLSNCSKTDLELVFHYTIPNSENKRDYTNGVTITPQFTATELMKTLHELGILSDTQFLLSHDAPEFGYGTPEDTLAQPADPYAPTATTEVITHS